MCVVYLNYRYYVKAAGGMLSIWYFGTLCAVIYSLNLDLANKCVPLKNSTALLQYFKLIKQLS